MTWLIVERAKNCEAENNHETIWASKLLLMKPVRNWQSHFRRFLGARKLLNIDFTPSHS
jgi:hypothetical protein